MQERNSVKSVCNLTDRQTERQTERQTDRQTASQPDRQTEKQTDKVKMGFLQHDVLSHAQVRCDTWKIKQSQNCAQTVTLHCTHLGEVNHA